MSPQSLPAITFDESIDGEYTAIATDRRTGSILAAAIGYYCDDVILRIDLQMIELGYNIYAPEDLN